MTGENERQRSLHQCAMWRRLAEQCRLSGEHDLESEAMHLAAHYRQRADAVQARIANARIGEAEDDAGTEMVGRIGFEPMTIGLKVRCSTN